MIHSYSSFVRCDLDELKEISQSDKNSASGISAPSKSYPWSVRLRASLSHSWHSS
jgi:hypothetical protein